MTDPLNSGAITLETIRSHLSAAEAALEDGKPTDPSAACQAALAELRRATAAHDRFVSQVSHDLRNRFTLVAGQAQLLDRYLVKGMVTPDRIQRALRQINRSIAEANEIVRRLNGS